MTKKLNFVPQKTDFEHPLHTMTLGQLLDINIAQYPDNYAVMYADRDYYLTWKEFGEQVDRFAKGMMGLGVKKGEKVAIWATNVPHWVTLMFATAKIGAILVTVNTNYKIAEIEYLLKQSETENLFLIDGFRDTDYVNTIYELVPELRTQPRDYFKSERLPFLKRVVFLGPQKHRGMYSVAELESMAIAVTDEEYEARQASLDCHDVVNMQYTSGTTGFPKGVMLTHYNIANDGNWIGRNQNLGPNDRVLLPVPLFHCFGCVLGVMACMNNHSTMGFLERYDAVTTMMSIEKIKATACYGVPTMYIGMLQHPLFEKFDFSSLRTGIMAGSPCPVKTMEEVMDKMNMKEITICYGLTECSPVISQTTWDEKDVYIRTSTVGRAMPAVEVKTINPETGEKCAVGEHGEVCCRGYLVMKGYYKMPEATAEAIDKDGWLHSGDIGMLDKDGYLHITGRLKDMIIRGGENVYPKEIEDFIHHMEGVEDVQVVGVPSKKYGEQVGAYIRLEKNALDITEDDVKDFCRGKIAWHKIPKFIAFVPEFPLTASGKIKKYELRKDAAQRWPEA
ncbi:MAG: AMP-binding protein [Candidatus Sumerlaeales bacterium]|nr:AMP-binding protein [Candidatus Sumerlaeales bacterium]